MLSRKLKAGSKMSVRVSCLPLYDQYFHNPSEQEGGTPRIQNWGNFKSQEIDFTTALSERPADFTIHNTIWNRAKNAIVTAMKIALFSYMLYPFVGWIIHKPLITLGSFVPQGAIVSFLQRNVVVQALSTCYNNTLTEAGKYIGATALKRLIYSWGAYTTLRYVIQRIVMLPLFPAQSRIVKSFFAPFAQTRNLDAERIRLSKLLDRQERIVRDVSLEKNGVRYSGLLIGHKNTINNGKWALQATGNLEPIEHAVPNLYSIYEGFEFNMLLINGPSVGRSEGQATPESMGDAQDVGISFMETALKAKQIVIAGRSLGGAAIGQAILKHEFKSDVKYLVVRQMTFDCVSNICSKIIAKKFPSLEWLVAKIIQWSGCEMDSVAASKKLQSLGIKEVIVQASHRQLQAGELPRSADFQTDGPIVANASLGYALVQEEITVNKVFHCLKDAPHMTNEAVQVAEREIMGM